MADIKISSFRSSDSDKNILRYLSQLWYAMELHMISMMVAGTVNIIIICCLHL
jgi:hypothetical protein